MSETIRSARLELAPFSAAFLRASLAGRIEEAAAELGLPLPEGWPTCEAIDWPDARAILGVRLAQLTAEPALAPWLLRGMVLGGDSSVSAADSGHVLVGCIGFHTAPGPEYLEPYAAGGLELGFRVFPEYRRRGFAREAVEAMMAWAGREHGVRRFVMSIRPGNVESQGLARGLGFVKVGSYEDPLDGEEDVLVGEWEGGSSSE